MEQIKNPSPYLLPGLPLDKRPRLHEKKRDLSIVELVGSARAVDTIIDLVSLYTTITREQIINRSRKRDIIQARHLTMYLCSMYVVPSVSLNDVAQLMQGEFTKRDHSSIIAGRGTIQEMLDDKQRGPYPEETIELLTKIETHLKSLINESNRTYWESRQR